jgi:hypothetical protein
MVRPRDMHFIVPGRCNELLDGTTDILAIGSVAEVGRMTLPIVQHQVGDTDIREKS